MKKAAKFLLSFLLLVFLSWLGWLNIALYYQPAFTPEGKVEVNADVLQQLRFLKGKIHAGAATDAQGFYPEGFVFLNALYGLSWCEYAAVLDHHSALYKEAHEEIAFAFSELNSEKGKAVFDRNLPVPYGVFYTGWNNYLLGKKLAVENPGERDSAEVALYLRQCLSVVNAIHNAQTPFPESYASQSWPSDACVAVASLSIEPFIRRPLFSDAMKEWIAAVKLRLDKNTGLIPHSVYVQTGAMLQEPRGNSQALMLNFLFDIDPVFARQQFALYHEKFLTTRFGLPGLREFANEEWAEGDVDSGPVIFGIGGAASLVGLRTMIVFGDEKTAIGLRNSIEAFGMAHTNKEGKKFLFGKVPMADAFIAWAGSKEITKDKMLHTNESWRTRFQMYSLLTTALLLVFLLWLWDRLPRSGKQTA